MINEDRACMTERSSYKSDITLARLLQPTSKSDDLGIFDSQYPPIERRLHQSHCHLQQQWKLLTRSHPSFDFLRNFVTRFTPTYSAAKPLASTVGVVTHPLASQLVYLFVSTLSASNLKMRSIPGWISSLWTSRRPYRVSVLSRGWRGIWLKERVGDGSH
jgi:hypothetical protein